MILLRKWQYLSSRMRRSEIMKWVQLCGFMEWNLFFSKETELWNAGKINLHWLFDGIWLKAETQFVQELHMVVFCGDYEPFGVFFTAEQQVPRTMGIGLSPQWIGRREAGFLVNFLLLMKQHDQGNLQKVEIVLTYDSSILNPSWLGDRVAGCRHSDRSRKLRAYILKHKHEKERAKWKWQKTLSSQIPSKVTYFHQQGHTY